MVFEMVSIFGEVGKKASQPPFIVVGKGKLNSFIGMGKNRSKQFRRKSPPLSRGDEWLCTATGHRNVTRKHCKM